MPSRILFVSLILCLTQLSFAKWEKIGLDGKIVTAIACGKPWTTPMVFAGTQSDGVFYRMDSLGAFNPLSGPGIDSLGPALKTVHCLYYVGGSMNIPILFAGTENGLFRYVFTSGLPPHWTRMADVPAIPVIAITAQGDTCFCATYSEVYRSFNLGNAWAACSTRKFLPPLQNMAWFTSLALWRGINVGSQVSAPKESWCGVLNSVDNGVSWKGISSVPGFSNPSVISLTTYSPTYLNPIRLLAGTSGTGGLFWTDDLDTGTWHELDPQLKNVQTRNLYVSYHTRSLIADIFAPTDSGVYILSDLVKPGEWVLSLGGTACGVTSFDSVDPKEWFAAMTDGVYRFTIDPASVFPGISNAVNAPPQVHSEMFYTLDGKKIHHPSGSGVYLLRNGQNGFSRIFINQQGKISHLK